MADREVPFCPRCQAMSIDMAILQHELTALRAQLQGTTARVRDLEARAKLTSRNSSKPPSSDPPGAVPRAQAPGPSGRKPGGQPGHKGTTRQPFAPEDVQHRIEVRPPQCAACHKPLPSSAPTSGAPGRHQVVDIPPTSAVVTEYVMHNVECSACGSTTQAELPADAPLGVVGLRLQAAMAILTGRFRLSRREGVDALESLFGPKARISHGWLSALEGRTSDALASAYAEAQSAVRSAAVVNADETPFRESRQKAWLWVAVTKVAALFRIDPERSAPAFRRLLGNFTAILGTDRFASYHRHPKRRRQICIAHLLRNFQELVDRGLPAKEIGQAGLDAIARIYEVWGAYKAQMIPFASVATRLRSTRATLLDALLRGATNADGKAAGMCKDLLKLFPCIWTFTRVEGVEPTNNEAERALRPAVLWRKGSFGCHSARGSRYAERMLTVVHTLRLQGRSVIDFIERALRAALLHTRPPRLILSPGTG